MGTSLGKQFKTRVARRPGIVVGACPGDALCMHVAPTLRPNYWCVVCLLDRDHVCRWDDVLSIGEQQRLSIARMYYHEPKFAVLDECTSAVSIDVEEALYRASVVRDITCITISQRLSLPEFHVEELKMGEDAPCGFVKRSITETENAVVSAI